MHEEHDTPAEAVGEQTEWQADQRTGEDRQRDHQAELRLAQPEFLLDADADDRKHRPHGKVHREGECAHAEHGVLFLTMGQHG
ncbi:hypothetical protein D3C78_1463010 [compost metagenome]